MPGQEHPSRFSGRIISAVFASCLLALTLMGAAQTRAAALYANFDPTQTSPVDYTTSYADISGYFSGCCVIYSWGAGFSFTAEESGVPKAAWLALQPIVAGDRAPGAMERFFRFTIYDSAASLNVVAQGGTLGRNVPLTGSADVFKFDLGRGGSYTDAFQRLTASDSLVAGQAYFAFFYQAYGALSQTHWMTSDESGASLSHCMRNYDSNPCAGPGPDPGSLVPRAFPWVAVARFRHRRPAPCGSLSARNHRWRRPCPACHGKPGHPAARRF